MIKAVIFDKDGVIVDSEHANFMSVKNAFKKLGIKLTRKEMELIIGKHPRDNLPHFSKKYKFSEGEFFKIQRDIYYKYYRSSKLFKEAISLIKRLHSRKMKIALATSSLERGTKLLLERAGLNNIFDVVVTREDCKRRKPHPEPYLITAKKLRVNPKNCLVVEDSLTGLIAAKSAGMKCIVIPNKYTKNHDFSKADLVVKSAKYITDKIISNL